MAARPSAVGCGRARSPRTSDQIEFGDFQTPLALARRAVDVVARSGIHPASILEPTCGTGSFLAAAAERFDTAALVGVERNAGYAQIAREALNGRADVREGDFFRFDWPRLLDRLPDPLVVIGNPPWVTNSELSARESSNLPPKTNFRNHAGLDALTGKSNFDISEWMLLRVLHWLNGRHGAMAMLCKTAVARKVLASAWTDSVSLSKASVHAIDTMAHFGASVDACLLVCEFSPAHRSMDCVVSHLDEASDTPTSFGYRDGHLVANIAKFERWKELAGPSRLRWRSGIKHDCGAVMELREEDGQLKNRRGEVVQVEDELIYPMLKTSEIAATPVPDPSRWMVVTQSTVGEDTSAIRHRAPLTWAYLEKHGAMLDGRGSSIYRNRPRFSIFGVGRYSFAPWKVAISGFYKRLRFQVVGPHRGKPVVLDDQSYFLPFETRAEANDIAALLNSDTAREFYEAFVFWDAKRPITSDLLGRLDLDALARRRDLVTGSARRPRP